MITFWLDKPTPSPTPSPIAMMTEQTIAKTQYCSNECCQKRKEKIFLETGSNIYNSENHDQHTFMWLEECSFIGSWTGNPKARSQQVKIQTTLAGSKFPDLTRHSKTATSNQNLSSRGDNKTRRPEATFATASPMKSKLLDGREPIVNILNDSGSHGLIRSQGDKALNDRV